MIYSECAIVDPALVHELFVNAQLKADWIQEDNFDIEKKHHPYLMDFDKCPDWFQAWGVFKDKIESDIVRKYL